MKKRLLVTSIVMMLVVAVALSTATYAWFTSNATVSASSITLTADTSTSTALGIGWSDGEAGTSISSNMSGTLAPMCPEALQIGTTTTAATDVTTNNIVFKTQTTKQLDSVFYFNGSGETATPVTYSTSSASSFYVKNLSNANSVSSITISAVFNTDTEVAGSGEAYTYAPITTGTIASGSKYYTRTGVAPNYRWEEHTVTGNDAIANTNYVAVGGTETVAAANTDYYSENAGTFTKLTNITVGETVVSSYYTFTETNFARTVVTGASKDGDDMVRVAIFRKNKTQVGTTGKYAWTDGNFTLIGVLGSANTAYTQVTSGEFNKNTTYYVKEGTTYTQTSITAADFANYINNSHANYGKLYTAANTAVYGPIGDTEPVKNLRNFEVKTSLELLDTGFELAPNSTVELVAIAWLDGTVFDDSRAGDIAGVSLKFHA